MNCVLNVKILLFSLCLELVLGKLWYEAQFTESILPCDDFENKEIDAGGIQLAMMGNGEDGVPIYGLSGPLVLNNEVDDGLNANLLVSKNTEVGKDYLFNSIVGVCNSMHDPDTPWYPMWDMMNITKCPIAAGSYQIKNFQLPLSCFKDLLSREFCGEYSITMSMTKDVDTTVSCHLVQVALIEHDD